jgi:glycosyltransferase involved in cell wall biosynthesis
LIYLVSTPPIQGVLGGVLKKIKKVPFVYNLQDIFPDSLAGTGLAKKGGLLWKIGRVIEDFTYRNADKIIVISEDFKRNIMAKGVPEEKIEVIYNWVDEEAVKHVAREDNVLFERYGLDRKRFYITYCGNIGLTQNLQMLTEVAKDLEGNEDIQFVLVGNGAYKDELERIVKEREIKNITLLPFQPYEEISHVFSLGDVSLVISKPGVGENSVPSKTWSILSASRPVLANFDENELKDIVAENQCGIFTKAGDKEAFTEAILKLYNNRELCEEYGKNGREFIMKNLTRAVGTQKYVDVIKSFEKVKREVV